MLQIAPALLKRLKNEKLLTGYKPFGSNISSTFDVTDPSGSLGLRDNEPIASVPDMDSAEEAIERAHEAFKTYSKTLASQRCKWLKKLADTQRANVEDLATILSCENGKPIREARVEIEYGASYLEWFGEEAKRAYGVTIPAPVTNRQIIVTREPLGVCGLITPFNFPNAMLLRKAAAALGAGCTIVSRPSEDVPLSAIAFSNMVQDIFPPNVFNLVTTSHKHSASVGKSLCTDPRVAKISFTGSTAVGRTLIAQTSSTVKRTSMELGGNAPLLVFDCADLNLAVDGLIASKFRSAGQTCICSNRIFVQRKIYDEFLSRLVDKVRKLKVGRALQEDVDVGCLIHDRAATRVEALVNEALETKGAKLLCGGKREESLNRNFFQPTVLVDVQDRCQVFQTEIFGPVAAISPFDSEEEVIERANGTRFGLASYIFATNASRIMRVSRALESGMIGVNTGATSSEAAPFGGVKESGFGREGSKYGLDDYTNLKYIAWQY